MSLVETVYGETGRETRDFAPALCRTFERHAWGAPRVFMYAGERIVQRACTRGCGAYREVRQPMWRVPKAAGLRGERS